MNIIEYNHSFQASWRGLFTSYFLEDLNCELPMETIRGKLCDFILDQWERGVIRIVLALEEGSPIGFSIFQIDTPESDWCKRPGWGCIREFFITRACRGNGYGRALADYTERQLCAMGAAQCYLTADEAVPFWEHCGWCNSHEFCSNDSEIMTK